ncbi:hypothetical protein ACFL2V_04150 [Pseudomonadota bacterium]
MTDTTIFEDPHQVTEKLAKFGVTKKELQSIALDAVSARNEATPFHPINAPGTFSYHAGVATSRMLFVQKNAGWKLGRLDGIEVVTNEALNLTVVFQNVDRACGASWPKAISAKREGSRKLVENPTRLLWPDMEEEAKQEENQNVWFACVSCNGEEVRMELSLPTSITDGQFSSFKERIFIITDNDWLPSDKDADDLTAEDQDFDIEVTRKA